MAEWDFTNLKPEQIKMLKKALGIGQTEVSRSRQREEEIGTREGYIKITQINAGGKKYFCTTQQEEQNFSMNNPNTKTETFKIELPVFVADKYLSDPENIKQFKKG